MLLKQFTIGKYIKRLILTRQTDRGSAHNTKSQALFKQVQASKGRRDEDFEKVNNQIFDKERCTLGLI